MATRISTGITKPPGISRIFSARGLKYYVSISNYFPFLVSSFRNIPRQWHCDLWWITQSQHIRLSLKSTTLFPNQSKNCREKSTGNLTYIFRFQENSLPVYFLILISNFLHSRPAGFPIPGWFHLHRHRHIRHISFLRPRNRIVSDDRKSVVRFLQGKVQTMMVPDAHWQEASWRWYCMQCYIKLSEVRTGQLSFGDSCVSLLAALDQHTTKRV